MNPMSTTKDINNNKLKNGISKNILFGILAGLIAAMGFTGIFNISAQVCRLLLLLLLMIHHKWRGK